MMWICLYLIRVSHHKNRLSDDCIWSKEAVRFFVQNMEAEQINVTYDQARFDEMVAQRGIAAPFIMIGNQVFHSFDADKLYRLLKKEV